MKDTQVQFPFLLPVEHWMFCPQQGGMKDSTGVPTEFTVIYSDKQSSIILKATMGHCGSTENEEDEITPVSNHQTGLK